LELVFGSVEIVEAVEVVVGVVALDIGAVEYSFA